MDIYGAVDVKVEHFQNMESGDVFCLYRDIKPSGAERIFMRCGGKSDRTAVNLRSGTIHTFEDKEPAKRLNIYLTIRD